jgi:hypothetical protein
MVKQKRAAITTRSIKNRHRSSHKTQPQPHETGEKKENRFISTPII